ncbi:olfactory receptor 9Q2-like [Halichoerus grypus]
MAEKNVTLVSEFLLIAFTDCNERALPLFLLFLFICLITLLGNLGMSTLIRVDGRLHTPMYFFLGHLSFVDMCYSSAVVPQLLAFTLSFCGDNEINFIFCDLPPLLKLTCGDSYTQEVVIIVFAIFVMPTCMVAILVSYLFIVVAIVRIPSAGGRAKNFSTCASHLMAVSLFFGTLIFMYLRDNSGHSSQEDRWCLCSTQQ